MSKWLKKYENDESKNTPTKDDESLKEKPNETESE